MAWWVSAIGAAVDVDLLDDCVFLEITAEGVGKVDMLEAHRLCRVKGHNVRSELGEHTGNFLLE